MKDANGQSLTYVYGRETQADADIAHVLTMDEARRIASNIAKLPREASAQLGELFHKPHVSACISIFLLTLIMAAGAPDASPGVSVR